MLSFFSCKKEHRSIANCLTLRFDKKIKCIDIHTVAIVTTPVIVVTNYLATTILGMHLFTTSHIRCSIFSIPRNILTVIIVIAIVIACQRSCWPLYMINLKNSPCS